MANARSWCRANPGDLHCLQEAVLAGPEYESLNIRKDVKNCCFV